MAVHNLKAGAVKIAFGKMVNALAHLRQQMHGMNLRVGCVPGFSAKNNENYVRDPLKLHINLAIFMQTKK